MNWDAGYMTEVEYIRTYCLDLNPLRLQLALLVSGWVAPEPQVACELGFGHGLSANIHAAASTVEWWGTDFNPAQADFARQLATRADSRAKLFDQAFSEFCLRTDLPTFDLIGLHGIWSWISDENRAVLVDFARRQLNPGGALYLSYNALPGWAAFAPLQHLMKRHNDVMSAPALRVTQRIDNAITFIERLLATNPLYLRANSKVGETLGQVQNEDRRYLAHEYFNAHWNAMHVAEVGGWLEATKCIFACTAHFLEQVDAINLTPEQQELLRNIPEPLFRETARDFILNKRFRRDYWVKGARRSSKLERAEKLRRALVVLTCARSDVPSAIVGSRYKAPNNVYAEVLDALADCRPRTLAEIEQAVRGRYIDFDEMLTAVLILAGAGYLQPAQDEGKAEGAKPATDRLNRALVDAARGDAEASVLASPVTGGGIAVSRIDQLFLLADRNGHQDPASRAAFVWSILDHQDERLSKEGKAIESVEDSLAELTLQAQVFAEKRAPILRELGIACGTAERLT